ncbi:MAG TPA: hypothetical protein VGE74_08610 [Gemmata sp.]
MPELRPDAPATREMRLALQALECCTLAELNAIELHHLRHIKQDVARRTAAECARRGAEQENVEQIREAERVWTALTATTAVVPPWVPTGPIPPIEAVVPWTAELETEARLQGLDAPRDSGAVDLGSAPAAESPTERIEVSADPAQWPESHDGGAS